MIARIATTLCLCVTLGSTAFARCEDYVPGPKPQNTGRDIVGQDIDQIIERGFIEFAVYEDFAPYSWEDGSTARGVDIELGRVIARDLGVEARFNFVAAGENLEADLRNYVWKGPLIGGRVANVMLHVPYDSNFSCRVEQVVFTGQYFNETMAIAYSRSDYPDTGPLPAYFRYDTVGVENDSIADFYLSSLAGGQLLTNIRRFPTPGDAMAALHAGEIMAAMGTLGQLEHGLTDKIAIHQPPLPGFSAGEWTLGVAVNHRYRPLSYAVDDAIRQAVSDGTMAAIFARHGLSFRAPEW